MKIKVQIVVTETETDRDKTLMSESNASCLVIEDRKNLNEK